MKNFLENDFLLQTETAQKLYDNHASKMPIIDYHCHLDPKQIAENHKFSSITELWLGGDHYKWRALRANGVNEKYITGDASDWEKFEKWAETIPYTMRNPLYHWTHLELQRVFGITKLLSPSTAREIFDLCNEQLQKEEFRARGLMKRFNVEVVCTTDDPIDSLVHHKALKDEGFPIKVLPTWRPDKAIAVESSATFSQYVDKLSEIVGVEIKNYNDYMQALHNRHDYFESLGCRLSDHGLANFYVAECSAEELKGIFEKIYIHKKELSAEEITKFKYSVLHETAIWDCEKGWAQQFHYGVIRNNNTRMFGQIGPDAGYDSILDSENVAANLAAFLDGLERVGKLAKTIIYNLNPRDNYLIATMIANFQDGSIPGKIQFGSGWWFLDQKFGMEDQMNALSSQGLLSRFVGMLTDSRSFVSYPRHEYFRRILCNLLGNDIESGQIPASEMEFIGRMVEDICYNNAKNYFNF